MTTVDLFAGPGGWSVAAAKLGLVEYGVEWDEAACLTARAAGHHRLQDDVRNVDPTDFDGMQLLLASPPCQGFSMAGLGAGRGIMPQLREALAEIALGFPIESVRASLAQLTHDDRVGLVVEPMHWIVAARPRNVALEQVPAVLPLWEAMAEHMRDLGYSVATGNLQAEQYDVPQTRKRAILVASLDREVALPTPVRAKYRKGAEPDPSLPRWISMAEALGWGMEPRPSMTVTSGGTSTGGAEVFGNGARQSMKREQHEGRWQLAAAAQTRPLDGTKPRDVDTELATTVAFGHNAARWRWEHVSAGTTGEGRPRNPGLDPAAAVTGKGTGYWMPDGTWRTDEAVKSSVRVTVQEAGVLQSFPADYPWQGTKTKQYEQCGNAIPCALAWHVIRAVLGLPVEEYPS